LRGQGLAIANLPKGLTKIAQRESPRSPCLRIATVGHMRVSEIGTTSSATITPTP
jgi:hypothetical protein